MKEWKYFNSGAELIVSSPNANEMKSIDSLADNINDDFISHMMRASKGVTLRTKKENYGKDIYGNPMMNESIQIVIPVDKAREFARWLLDVTSDL